MTAQPRNTAARTGALVFTTLSVVLAAGAGFLIWRLLAAGGYDREPTRLVVVAREPIGAGQPLREGALRLVPWPASAVPAGAYTSVQPLLTPSPAVPTTGFVAGEPILKERLASPEAGAGLSALVNKDARAVAVQVDRAVAAARLVYPGARVDVIVTLEDRLRGVVVTRTVLEDVRVLAVGTYADVDAARRGTDPQRPQAEADAVVTLEVTPADAEKLALSARQGKLDLSLRAASDRGRSAPSGVAMTELLSAPRPAEAARVEPSATAAPGSASAPTPEPVRRRPSSPNPAAAPTVRSNPRQPGGDDKSKAPSTIEVYSVPTQAR